MRVLLDVNDLTKLDELRFRLDDMLDECIIDEYYYSIADADGTPTIFDFFDAKDIAMHSGPDDMSQDEVHALAQKIMIKCWNDEKLKEEIGSAVRCALIESLKEDKL